MNRMKNGLVLAALSLALLGVTGCANLQQPAAASAPAPAPAAPALEKEEVRASLAFGGVLISIYHPDTRTMYLWSGDPRPNPRRPMTCVKLQLAETPSATPTRSVCQ